LPVIAKLLIMINREFPGFLGAAIPFSDESD